MTRNRFGQYQRVGQEGFTLLEMLVVSGIIALLSLIAITLVSDVVNKARAVRTVNDMAVISKGIDAFAKDNGGIPNFSGLTSVDQLKQFLVPTYLKFMPTKDAWGNNIYYEAIVIDASDDDPEDDDHSDDHFDDDHVDDDHIDDHSDDHVDDDHLDDDHSDDDHLDDDHSDDHSDDHADDHSDDHADESEDNSSNGSSSGPALGIGMSYRLYSFGKYGTPDSDVVTGIYMDPTSDIVAEDGFFIQWKY
ncbi:MAG: type II secretion system protein [Acidobacteriota bacterium]